MSVRWGGNEYEYGSSDPYHEISPVRNPEASNYFPDGPTRDTLGDEGSDVEGAVIGLGRSGGVDGTG